MPNIAFSEAMNKAFELAHPSKDRIYRLAALAASLKHVQGIIVECGAYRGGTTIALAAACPDRGVFSFDTFKGMPQVSQYDQHSAGDFDVTFDEVYKETSQFENIFLIEGDICQTIPAFDAPQIALLFMDCDLYAPHVIAFEQLWSRIVPGGIVVLDDYTTSDCMGVRRAVDEFFGADKVKQRFGFWTVEK